MLKFTEKMTICGTEIRFQQYLEPIYKKGGKEKKQRLEVSLKSVRYANADMPTRKMLGALAVLNIPCDIQNEFKAVEPFKRVAPLQLPKTVAEYEKLFADRSRNAKKRKRGFFDIVACNPDLQRFMTLTFADNVIDVAFANSCFNTFMTKLRRSLGKSFKYVCVIEFQERGAIHYHLLHNANYLRNKFIETLWGFGFTCNRSVDVSKNNNACAYLSAYMTKATEKEKLGCGKKAFHCSQNCARPVVLENVDGDSWVCMHKVLARCKKQSSPRAAFEYAVLGDWSDNYCNVVVYPLDFAFYAEFLSLKNEQNNKALLSADVAPINRFKAVYSSPTIEIK